MRDDTATWDARHFSPRSRAKTKHAAIAHMRGALAEELPMPSFSPSLREAALAHYADFGHCAIYTIKSGQLIARLGDAAAEPLLLASRAAGARHARGTSAGIPLL